MTNEVRFNDIIHLDLSRAPALFNEIAEMLGIRYRTAVAEQPGWSDHQVIHMYMTKKGTAMPLTGPPSAIVHYYEDSRRSLAGQVPELRAELLIDDGMGDYIETESWLPGTEGHNTARAMLLWAVEHRVQELLHTLMTNQRAGRRASTYHDDIPF